MKKMGYTHYTYRKEREIEKERFAAIVADFKKFLPLFRVLDVQLAGGTGTGMPVLDSEEVIFNGSSHCGHPPNKNIVIPWPSEVPKFGVAKSADKALCGSWFAGVVLNQRACDGDCSYETFCFPRRIAGSPNERGLFFDCCKTAFRPYDLAVQVFLVVAKHHMGNELIVKSDGDVPQWLDAVKLCENVLGYGSDFVLGDQSPEEASGQGTAETAKNDDVLDRWETHAPAAKRRGERK
jgi:hypothetical protein